MITTFDPNSRRSSKAQMLGGLPGTKSPLTQGDHSEEDSSATLGSAHHPSDTSQSELKNPTSARLLSHSNPDIAELKTCRSSPPITSSKPTSLLRTSLLAFSRLATSVSPTKMSSRQNKPDEDLLHIDIEAELYPDSSPGESCSPAAYTALQINALKLAQKLHKGYRENVLALRLLEFERGTHKEDLLEARARALRLKQQVETMISQAAEHERSMMELLNELAAEKRLRITERDERERNLNMVPETPESGNEGSILEDLRVDEDERQRKWRQSASTIRSNMSFDTDEESLESDSIFSRSRSPTILSVPPADSGRSATPTQSKGSTPLCPPRSRSSVQMTALEKILKGMTKADEAENCRKCRGQDAGTAWDTVGFLKDENKSLRVRVGELEVAIEGAIDAVNGVGM